MKINIQPFLILYFIGLSVSLSAETLQCDLNDHLSQASALNASGRNFSAIHVLEQNYRHCAHARYLLEIGQLYFDLGHSERAINTWQLAMNNHELPDRVAKKVKVKIIQAHLEPDGQVVSDTLLTTRSNIRSDDDVSTGLAVSYSASFSGRKQNVFGYGASLHPYVHLALSSDYFWQEEYAQRFLFSEAGVKSAGVHSYLKLGLLAYHTKTDDENNVGLGLKTEWAGKKLFAVAEGYWVESDELWQVSNRYVYGLQGLNIELNAHGKLQESTFTDAQFELATQFHQAVKPRISLMYRPDEDWVSAGLESTLYFGDHVWLSAGYRTSLSETPQWQGKVSLTYRFNKS